MVGIGFWILAIVAVVSAISSVTVKRAVYAIISQYVTILSVVGIMVSLGVIGLSLIYLLISGIVVAGLFFVGRKRINTLPVAGKLESHNRTFLYFAAALLIFSGCLLLIAYTDVWQYSAAPKTAGMAEFFSIVFNNYLLPFLLAKLILIISLVILIVRLKHRAA